MSTSTASIATEILDLLDRQDVAWNLDCGLRPNEWGGFDLELNNDRAMRVTLDDTRVQVFIFTGGRAMLPSAEAAFDNMPASVIVAAIAAYLEG